jgi:hypothetical protein
MLNLVVCKVTARFQMVKLNTAEIYQISLGDQLKEDEVGEVYCSIWWRREMHKGL